MIEEAFEAVDAIEADHVAHMREELGDVLLQVVLQSQIAPADAGEVRHRRRVSRHRCEDGSSPSSCVRRCGGARRFQVLGIWDAEKLKEKQAADAEIG